MRDWAISCCAFVCRHEDGTVRFWDASGVCLHPMYKLSTAGVFHTDTDPNDNMNQSTEGEWPLFRKVSSSCWRFNIAKTTWLKYYYHLLLHGWVWPGWVPFQKFWYFAQWYFFDTRCFQIGITAQNFYLQIRIFSKPMLLYSRPLHICLNFALVNDPSQWSGAMALIFPLAQAKLCKCL